MSVTAVGTPDYVCPRCLSPLEASGERHLVCTRDRTKFDVERGVPQLRVLEPDEQNRHHLPRREFGRDGRLSFPSPVVKYYRRWPFWIGSYEQYIADARSGSHRRWMRSSFLFHLLHLVPRQKRLIDAMLDLLSRRFPRYLDRPADDYANAGIYARGAIASSLFKRLEKEFFWDEVELEHPAYEFGVSWGHSSAYMFKDRGIELGSEYVTDALLDGSHPHGRLFSANINYVPLPSESLRAVVCSQTVPCVYVSIVSMLREVNRILEPGGIFAFTAHGPAFLNALPREGVPDLGLSPGDCFVHNEMRSCYMKHLYSTLEWRELLETCGFELVQTRGIASRQMAMFHQIFHNFENSSYSLFTDTFRRMRLSRLLFGGTPSYLGYEAKLNRIMTAVHAYEREHHFGLEWDSDEYLEGGLVARKREGLPMERRAPDRG